MLIFSVFLLKKKNGENTSLGEEKFLNVIVVDIWESWFVVERRYVRLLGRNLEGGGGGGRTSLGIKIILSDIAIFGDVGEVLMYIGRIYIFLGMNIFLKGYL